MNRQQRRQAERSGRSASLSVGDGIRALHLESGGVVLLQIIRPHEADALVELAAEGDAEAWQLLDASRQIIVKVADASLADPVRCAACSAPVRDMRFACAVVLPHKADPQNGMGMAICWDCGTDMPSIMEAAQRAVTKLWPATRAFRPTHTTGGRA